MPPTGLAYETNTPNRYLRCSSGCVEKYEHTDYYSLLGIDRAASPAEIEKAYEAFREKIGSFSPGVTITDSLVARDHPKMWQALCVLRDAASREAYDSSVFAHAEMPAAQTADDLPGESFASKAIEIFKMVIFFGAIIAGIVALASLGIL